MEPEGDGDTNYGWAHGSKPKGMVQELKDFEIRGQVELILTTTLLR